MIREVEIQVLNLDLILNRCLPLTGVLLFFGLWWFIAVSGFVIADWIFPND